MGQIEALETESKKDEPVLVVQMHKRVWRFFQPKLRPSKIRELRNMAERLDGRKDDFDPEEGFNVLATMKDVLRSALPSKAEQQAFDIAPFDTPEILEIGTDYFNALGVSVGESSASPGSSATTARPSKRNSRRGRRR